MAQIVSVYAREILDSRGNPTVEAEIITEDGHMGRAAVPSGASTGEHEALEMRDGDKKRFLGKGVQNAVKNVCEVIAPEILGLDASAQKQIDYTMLELDGTENKSKLGANAILAVSMACAKAAADAHGLPLFRYLGGVGAATLPVPLMNIINGGAHADNNLDIQEFMIVPSGFDNFADSLRAGVETFHALKKILSEQGKVTSVGDEGGFAPSFDNAEQALKTVLSAIEAAGYKPGEQVFLALDVAASEFFDKAKNVYNYEGKARTSGDMVDLYKTWAGRYPLVSIEDGLAENDWAGWAELTKVLGKNVQIVGDDLFVTSTARLTQGIEKQVANSILVKVNQIGSLTETMEAINTAQHHGYTAIISHRSGETEDSFIADLAVATNAGQIKTGSASRSDRIAKYNQLLRIAGFLGPTQKYLGTKIFRRN